MKTLFFIYTAALVLMSVIAFIAYGRDKRLAKSGSWRTPERTLLLLSACCGGIGAFVGMRVFRHKTQHPSFKIIVPLTMILQIALLAALAYFAFLK
ncbi:MAG: DUF1294 domain-containing protein [Clostridia bacterium]|nr:DUF1294 domain-containing protein [Clostridia bacterium]